MANADYTEDVRRDLHAFKELRFFLSHAVPSEVRCRVCRLELPLVADYLGEEWARDAWDASKGTGKAEDGDMDAVVRRVVAEPELVATVQVFPDGRPMHAISMRWDRLQSIAIAAGLADE